MSRGSKMLRTFNNGLSLVVILLQHTNPCVVQKVGFRGLEVKGIVMFVGESSIRTYFQEFRAHCFSILGISVQCLPVFLGAWQDLSTWASGRC